MNSGNEDKAKGTAKDVKGHVKEAAGKATNNPNLKREGRQDQAEGHAQKAAGDIKKTFNK